MTSTGRVARLAGLMYLLLSIFGFYALIYIPGAFYVRGDVAATAHKILAAETLYRSGIVSDLVGQAFFILVGLALYRLLKGVDRNQALLMLILILAPIPITFIAEVHHLDVLKLLDPAGPAAALGESQRNAQMMLALGSYQNCMLVAEIFWGLWLFPLGSLIFRSGFLPRFLGVLLFVAGFAYLTETITWLLAPAYAHAVGGITSKLRVLELVTPLWLLVMGARDRPLAD